MPLRLGLELRVLPPPPTMQQAVVHAWLPPPHAPRRGSSPRRRVDARRGLGWLAGCLWQEVCLWNKQPAIETGLVSALYSQMVKLPNTSKPLLPLPKPA